MSLASPKKLHFFKRKDAYIHFINNNIGNKMRGMKINSGLVDNTLLRLKYESSHLFVIC